MMAAYRKNKTYDKQLFFEVGKVAIFDKAAAGCLQKEGLICQFITIGGLIVSLRNILEKKQWK